MGKEYKHSDSRQNKSHVLKENSQPQERTEHVNNPGIKYTAKMPNSCREDPQYIYQNGGRSYSRVDIDKSSDHSDEDSVKIDGWGLCQYDTFAGGDNSCRDENNTLDRDDDDVNNDNDDDGHDDNDENSEGSGDEEGCNTKGTSSSSNVESNESQTLASESAQTNAECEYQKPRLGLPKAASNHGNEKIKGAEKVLRNAEVKSRDLGRASVAGTTSFPGLFSSPADEVVAGPILHPNNLDSQATLSGNNATRLTQGARPKTQPWLASDINCSYNSRESYSEDTGIDQAFLVRHTTDISLLHSPRAIDWNLSGASTSRTSPSYVGSSNKSNSALLRRSPNSSVVDHRFSSSGLRQPGGRYQSTRTDFRRDWQLSYQSQAEHLQLLNSRNPRNADCHQPIAQPKSPGNIPSVTRYQVSSLTNRTFGPQLAPTSRNAESHEALLSAGIQGTSGDNALVALDRKLAEAYAVVERITKEQDEAMKARREKALRERERMERIEREERERREIERREREASQMREREQREREAREREVRARREREEREREARETREQEKTERNREEQRVRQIQGERTPIQESINWQCQHYQRLCSVSFPCCGVFYPCHRCHNESDACEIDDMKAKQATHVKCASCGHEDEISERSQDCSSCGERLSQYFCAKCKHFTGMENKPFHCDKCGICRIHSDKSFHCDVCNVCLDKRLEGNHKCRVNSGHDECCICLEDAFSGCQILPCSHKVHKECAVAMIQNGIRSCPICRHPLFNQ